MGLIVWLLIGLAAGAIAKMLTPQKEKGGWISSIIVGILGSFVGKITGLGLLLGGSLVGNLIVATAGAFILLFIYHRFLADKLNLPI